MAVSLSGEGIPNLLALWYKGLAGNGGAYFLVCYKKIR